MAECESCAHKNVCEYVNYANLMMTTWLETIEEFEEKGLIPKKMIGVKMRCSHYLINERLYFTENQRNFGDVYGQECEVKTPFRMCESTVSDE